MTTATIATNDTKTKASPQVGDLWEVDCGDNNKIVILLTEQYAGGGFLSVVVQMAGGTFSHLTQWENVGIRFDNPGWKYRKLSGAELPICLPSVPIENKG